MVGTLLPCVWRPDLPTGAYVEGLDQALGRFCAFAFVDRVEVTHFERRLAGRPASALAEVATLLNPKGSSHEPHAAHLP